jgi:YD repeat-containing protein
MKISYDPEVDALSIVFRDTTVTTEQLSERIAVDYDAEGNVAGIEVLNASKQLGDCELLSQVNPDVIRPHLLEETALGRDWLRPEEDEA